MIVIKKGIDLPISGSVQEDTIHLFTTQTTIGIIGDDYIGLKPTMMVTEGDKVKKGQALFEDKKNSGVLITSPVSGEVIAIERGERRRFLSLVIQPDGQDRAIQFPALTFTQIAELNAEQVRQRLQQSGCWSMFRKRPFDKIPGINATTQAVFVNTMDSNPLALNPLLAIKEREEDFQAGLQILAKLTTGNIHVTHSANSSLPSTTVERVKYHVFSGIHPAGLVGTHIHFIDPVSQMKSVWHIDLQDLLAIGYLFLHGEIDSYKIVSIAGPGIKQPKNVKVLRGINLSTLLAENLQEGEQRVISGSVFSGRHAKAPTDFLGAYDRQVVALPEGRDAIFFEFVRPGMNSYSRTRAYLGRFLKSRKLPFTTSLQGAPRPIVPFGIYEEVMPLDILPTLLLKALAMKDTDSAAELGALELVEEDIALLTYVDPGKHDFGAILRETLEQIEEEG